MDEATISALVNLGTLGPVLVAVGWYVIRREAEHKAERSALQEQLSQLQEKRTEDAKAVVSTVLELTQRQTEVSQELGTALSQNTASVARLEESVRELTARRR